MMRYQNIQLKITECLLEFVERSVLYSTNEILFQEDDTIRPRSNTMPVLCTRF